VGTENLRHLVAARREYEGLYNLPAVYILWVSKTCASRRYSWIMPPARSRRWTRNWSRLVTPSGSGRSGGLAHAFPFTQQSSQICAHLGGVPEFTSCRADNGRLLALAPKVSNHVP